MKRSAPLVLSLVITGCEPRGLPPAACHAARDGLAGAAASGQMRFEPGAGRASVRASAWAQMAGKDRRNLARLLAVDKACPDGKPEETMVVVSTDPGGEQWRGFYPELGVDGGNDETNGR